MKRPFTWIITIFLLLAILVWYTQNSATQPDIRSGKADKVVVWKSKRELCLFRNNQVIWRISITLGNDPLGHKEREGDEKTPEGHYTLDWRNDKSICYKSIHVSYPNQADQAHARQQGFAPGGSIMIHGLPNRLGWVGRWHTCLDWTNGCVGVTNQEMDIIWALVDNGTPIEIRK